MLAESTSLRLLTLVRNRREYTFFSKWVGENPDPWFYWFFGIIQPDFIGSSEIILVPWPSLGFPLWPCVHVVILWFCTWVGCTCNMIYCTIPLPPPRDDWLLPVLCCALIMWQWVHCITGCWGKIKYVFQGDAYSSVELAARPLTCWETIRRKYRRTLEGREYKTFVFGILKDAKNCAALRPSWK